MKPGETIHLGDGAYLHFDGHGLELRANHHEHPTDRVYLDPYVLENFLEAITAIRRQNEPDGGPPSPPLNPVTTREENLDPS